MIKRILKPFYYAYKIFPVCWKEYIQLISSFSSTDEGDLEAKLRNRLFIQSHIIEKGLSLKDVRLGFGEPKVKNLLNSIENYYKKYKEGYILYFALSVVQKYLDFHQAHNFRIDAEIVNRYGKLKELVSKEIAIETKKYEGGTKQVKRDEIVGTDFAFEDFIKNRHSVRSFTGNPISVDDLKDALRLAEYTPSACNRQPWVIRVFTKKENIDNILTVQTGSRQFKEDVSAVILVASSYNSFGISEKSQPYVNGGLYAMTLLYALHAKGLGAIPLNMGLMSQNVEKIKKMAGLRVTDVPVMLIAVGDTSDTLNVANSCRVSYKEYTKFDE
jgi:nitroreductase